MNVMILAAGRGTRLGAEGETTPKVLLEVGGEPLLARHLQYLERNGASRVVINTHHLGHEVQTFVREYRTSLDVVCVPEEQLLGTAGGVRNALSYLLPGPFAVMYGDVIFDEPLAGLAATHERKSAVATLAVHEAASAEGKGVVEVDETDRVVRFVEKGQQRQERVLINSGIYILEEALVGSLPLGTPLDFGHEVLPNAVLGGSRVFVHRLSEPVIDIGTPAALASARAVAPPTAKSADA